MCSRHSSAANRYPRVNDIHGRTQADVFATVERSKKKGADRSPRPLLGFVLVSWSVGLRVVVRPADQRVQRDVDRPTLRQS
jgi:hypothetical protein